MSELRRRAIDVACGAAIAAVLGTAGVVLRAPSVETEVKTRMQNIEVNVQRIDGNVQRVDDKLGALLLQLQR